MEFLVVNGNEFVGEVPFMNHFWPHHGFTEEDFVRLLQLSEAYFKKVNSVGVDQIDHKYFIEAPQDFLDTGIANHVDHITDRESIKAYDLYISQKVCVKHCDGGYKFCGNDGRHRFMVAKKYGLDLLVCVVD